MSGKSKKLPPRFSIDEERPTAVFKRRKPEAPVYDHRKEEERERAEWDAANQRNVMSDMYKHVQDKALGDKKKSNPVIGILRNGGANICVLMSVVLLLMTPISFITGLTWTSDSPEVVANNEAAQERAERINSAILLIMAWLEHFAGDIALVIADFIYNTHIVIKFMVGFVFVTCVGLAIRRLSSGSHTATMAHFRQTP